MLTLVKEKPQEFIKEIPDKSVEEANALSNDQLTKGGMVQVTSWMRSNSSNAARRSRKAKERAAAGSNGKPAIKQLNLAALADDNARAALKSVSALMIEGKVTAADLEVVGRLRIMRYGAKVDQIYAADGWRAPLLRRILR